MATTYLIDSNVLIDYTSKKFEPAAEQKLDFIFNTSFNYSVISKIEVLGYNAPAETLLNIEKFLSVGFTHYLTEEICKQTILIRRGLPKTKLPDLIIASTAIVSNSTLLTRNVGDFKNIPDLKVVDPWSWVNEI